MENVLLRIYCTVLVILCVIYWKLRRWKSEEPPAFSGYLPILGHLHLVIGGSNRIINVINRGVKESATKGHALSFWMGPKLIYVLTDPDDCLLVANTCFKNTYSFAAEVFGNGLLTCPVSVWKERRKLLNQAFSHDILDVFIPIFNHQSRRLVEAFRSRVGGGYFDNLPYIRRNTLQTICNGESHVVSSPLSGQTEDKKDRKKKFEIISGKCNAIQGLIPAFTRYLATTDLCDFIKKVYGFLEDYLVTAMGIDITEQTETNLKYLESVDCILGIFVERLMNPFLHIDFIYSYTKLKRRQESNLKALNEMSTSVLEKKKSQLKLMPASNTGTKITSFMDLLLEGRVLPDQEIKDEVDTFMAAGHDTIASLLTSVLVLIGSFPDVQERIVQEFKQIFETRELNEDLTRQDLSRLYYLEAVIKETMRYYSVVPFITRKLDRDIQIKNYTLKSGNACMLLLHGLHRHSMWGADADEFKPERWLDRASLPSHSAAFGGFSIGRRNCIGQHFAMISAKTLVVHLLRHYRIKSDHTKYTMKVDFVFRPSKGYYVSLEERAKN